MHIQYFNICIQYIDSIGIGDDVPDFVCWYALQNVKKKSVSYMVYTYIE